MTSDAPPRIVTLLSMMSRRRRRQFAAIVALMLVGAVAELMTIGAVLPFLQLVVAPQAAWRLTAVRRAAGALGLTEPAQLLMPAACLLILIAVAATAIRLLLNWATQTFVYRLAHDFDMRIYERMIRQPYALYVRRNSSEILAGFDKINGVAHGILLPMMQGFTSAVIAAAITGLLLLVDPVAATLSAATIGAVYAVINPVTRRRLLEMGRRSATVITDRLKIVQETHGGMRDIILEESHPLFERKFRALDREYRDLSARTNFLVSAPRYVVEGASMLLIAFLALYFAHRPGGLIGAVPVLGALALGAQRLLPLVQQIHLGFAQFTANRSSLADVVALMTAPVSSALPRPPAAEIRPFTQTLELRNLGFSYEGGGRAALRDINAVIAKGTRCGFIGKTGSGKSTLVDVIMGLLPPTAGAVLIDGSPLDAATLARWQAQIAHVPQSIFLADDSIAANIAFGMDPASIDREAVRRAARAAGLGDFVESLPEGYETLAGERGVRLSGGQRQRIGIARALYREAAVLVLDEATSALDDATEAQVMASIDALDRDLTVLIIAHRLSTLAGCDIIFQLEDGAIVARGDYAGVVGSVREQMVASHLRS